MRGECRHFASAFARLAHHLQRITTPKLPHAQLPEYQVVNCVSLCSFSFGEATSINSEVCQTINHKDVEDEKS